MKTFSAESERDFPDGANGKFDDKRSGRLTLKTSKGLRVYFFFNVIKMVNQTTNAKNVCIPNVQLFQGSGRK